MKAAMEDRTPRSSGETEDEKKGREGKRGKGRQVCYFRLVHFDTKNNFS